jgi:peroxiredoxin
MGNSTNYDNLAASLSDALRDTVTTAGKTLAQLSDERPVLIVFLRHAGCTFCREAAADLAARRAEIQRQGTQIVLVHMGSVKQGHAFFAQYGLDDLPQVSDPGRQLYQAFDLDHGTVGQLLGPRVWWRGFKAGILRGHGVGKWQGDVLQMPGTFLVYRGQIVKAFRHKTAADRPDYAEMAACEL